MPRYKYYQEDEPDRGRFILPIVAAVVVVAIVFIALFVFPGVLVPKGGHTSSSSNAPSTATSTVSQQKPTPSQTTQTQTPTQAPAQTPTPTQTETPASSPTAATQTTEAPDAAQNTDPNGNAVTAQGDAAGWTTSGDPELDAILDSIVQEQTGTGPDALHNAYDYVAANYTYTEQNELPPGDWQSWSVPYAKEMYQNGSGNCYRYSSLMCWIARRLGYDAKAVSGRVPWQGEMGVHSWTEVNQDGTEYVIDADFHKYLPEQNWFMVTYDEAPTNYQK